MALVDWAQQELTSARMPHHAAERRKYVSSRHYHRPLTGREIAELERRENAAMLEMVDAEEKERKEAEREANFQAHGNDPQWRLTNEECAEKQVRIEAALAIRRERREALEKKRREAKAELENSRARAKRWHERFQFHQKQGLGTVEAATKAAEGDPYALVEDSPPSSPVASLGEVDSDIE